MFRRFIVAAALLLGASSRPQPARAQHIVVFDDHVRALLNAEWDAHAKDPYQSERAYCVRYQLDTFADEFAYRVTDIDRAIVLQADQNRISFDCPIHSAYMALLHVHPPATCAPNGECVLGGAYAYQCFSSPQDDYTLLATHHKFGLIQCDRNAVISFWPDNILPDGKPARSAVSSP
jgi:hypothetical protein